VYAKLFEQIFDSSIAENYKTRHIFEDLFVLADREGILDMTLESIARRTNVPQALIENAIDELCKPDPKSRSKEHEGRRLIPLDPERGWGWIVVNYKKYRDMIDEDAKRNYHREDMRKRRAAKKAEQAALKSVKDTSLTEITKAHSAHVLNGVKNVKPSSSDSSSSSSSKKKRGGGKAPPSDSPKKKKPTKRSELYLKEDAIKDELPDMLNTSEFREVWVAYVGGREARNKLMTKYSAKLHIGKLLKMGSVNIAIQSVENSVCNSWCDVWPPRGSIRRQSNLLAGGHTPNFKPKIDPNWKPEDDDDNII